MESLLRVPSVDPQRDNQRRTTKTPSVKPLSAHRLNKMGEMTTSRLQEFKTAATEDDDFTSSLCNSTEWNQITYPLHGNASDTD